jgi:hypothetical protein
MIQVSLGGELHAAEYLRLETVPAHYILWIKIAPKALAKPFPSRWASDQESPSR